MRPFSFFFVVEPGSRCWSSLGDSSPTLPYERFEPDISTTVADKVKEALKT